MATVNNMHVRFLCDKISRFTFEVIKSQSSNLNAYRAADATRLSSYLEAIDVAHAWVISLPEMDLPETAPNDYQVEDFPTKVDAENESVNMIQDLLEACYVEMSKGQSAMMPAGLTSHDSKRLTDAVEHCRKFLNEYILVVQPLDQPESTPMEESTGKGN